jgi:hypothetical protein
MPAGAVIIHHQRPVIRERKHHVNLNQASTKVGTPVVFTDNAGAIILMDAAMSERLGSAGHRCPTIKWSSVATIDSGR